MKVIFGNYASPTSTEAIYLTEILNSSVNSIEARLWDENKISAYDMFDSLKPDLYITSYNQISRDVLKYLSKSSQKIDVVLNVTGATQEELDNINQIFKELKISSPFLFDNTPSLLSNYTIQPNQIKIESILPGADVFINRNAPIDFNVGAAIVSTNPDKKENVLWANYETHHKVLISGENNDDYDLCLPSVRFTSLCDNYANIVFYDDVYNMFSQNFFDILLSAKNFDVEMDDENLNKYEKVWNSLFSSDGLNMQDVKREIREKHTNFDRAARLLQKLGLKDEVEEVKRAKAKL